jgi:aminopeptidase YwaD
VDIPIHLMYKFEPLPGEKRYACPGSGGGWWWHAEEDRLDKVDPELLLRDTRLYVDTVLGLTGAQRLPADLPAYFGRTREILSGAARRSGEGFDLSSVLAALNSLERCAAEATARVFDDDRAADFVVRRVGGTMNRLMYSSCSKYGFDPTFPARPFQGLRTGESFFPGVPGDRALFARTGFLRQVNRFVGETEILEEELGHIGPGSGR